ncbi:MAG: MoxR family ATPase, partial [Bacteroidota bacterium]
MDMEEQPKDQPTPQDSADQRPPANGAAPDTPPTDQGAPAPAGGETAAAPETPAADQGAPAPPVAATPAAPASSPAAPETPAPDGAASPAASAPAWQQQRVDLEKIRSAVYRVKHEMRKVIVGQDQMVDLLLAGLFAGGHILMEGVPGIAKTLSAKLLARTMSVDFSRIQFTPDLMPTDVTGTSIFNLKSSEFNFNKGPIFSNVILIDEINRAPAKTQAALFEVMEERQVTVDGKTYQMEFPFFVVATQNPIEQEGTYQLPEAQLDRFIFKIKLTYPTLDDELEILKRFRDDFTLKATQTVEAAMTAEDLRECRGLVEKILIKDDLLRYIAQIVDHTRNSGDLFLGASPRASLAILRTSKAIAAMNGRDFVTPDDVKFVATPVLNHRVILSPDREMEGVTAEDVIREI